MFESLTVIIPTSNETDSLLKTVYGVLNSKSYNDISKIILFLKSENCPSAKIAKQIVKEDLSDKIEITIQKTATYDTAFKEIPFLVKSSHFIILVSDGEMDPDTIEKLLPYAKENPNAVVCGSKWHKDSVVENASFIRSIGSKALNKFAALVFGVNATDIFSIFQICPLKLYKGLNTNISEYTLKPLRMGIEYIEIPTFYKREEGRKSNFNLSELSILALRHILSIFRIRFTPKNKL